MHFVNFYVYFANSTVEQKKYVSYVARNFTTLMVLKSGSLNLVQPSGPVQPGTGIALPFYVVTNNKRGERERERGGCIESTFKYVG